MAQGKPAGGEYPRHWSQTKSAPKDEGRPMMGGPTSREKIAQMLASKGKKGGKAKGRDC